MLALLGIRATPWAAMMCGLPEVDPIDGDLARAGVPGRRWP